MKNNYIVLHDKTTYYLFERLGKDVPYGAYNPDKALGKGDTYSKAVESSNVPIFYVEEKPIEVMWNE